MKRILCLAALVAALGLAACESSTHSASATGAGDDGGGAPPQTESRYGQFQARLTAPEGLLPTNANVLTRIFAADPEYGCAEPFGALVYEEQQPVDPAFRMVEFSAMLPAGDYCLSATVVDPDGLPLDVCAAPDVEPFTIVPRSHLVLTLEFVCAPDDGLVVIGVDFVVGGVRITDIDCDRFWDYTLPEVVVCQVEATGEGALTYDFQLFHRPPAGPGEYSELIDLGEGAVLFASKTASADHVILIRVADEAGGYAYVTFPVDLAPSPDALALELPFGAPVAVDLTPGAPGTSDFQDEYDVAGTIVAAPGEELGLVLTGCGGPVTLTTSDPAMALFVVPDTEDLGAAPGEAIAHKASGAAEVTFAAEAGARYVVYVERFGFGAQTTVLATGCP